MPLPPSAFSSGPPRLRGDSFPAPRRAPQALPEPPDKSPVGQSAISGLVHRTAEKLVSAALVIPRLRQANAGLRDEIARMRRVFAHASIGVIMADEHGCITEVNDLLCECTGYSRAEFLAMTIRDLIHPGDLESHL